jgi:hypothetical protein
MPRKMTGQHRNSSRLLIPRQTSSCVFTPDNRPDAAVQCSAPGSGYSPIEERAVLESDIATWERRLNASREKIQWMFDCEKARKKMRHAYPQIKPDLDALPAAA